MTVAELIEVLRGKPQDLQVAYRLYSEYALLDKQDITVQRLGKPRADGWVPDHRDGESQEYLIFPGN